MKKLAIGRYEPIPDQPGQSRFIGNITVKEFDKAIDELLIEHNLLGQIDATILMASCIPPKASTQVPAYSCFICYVIPGSNEGYYVVVETEFYQPHKPPVRTELLSLRTHAEFEIAHKISGLINQFLQS